MWINFQAYVLTLLLWTLYNVFVVVFLALITNENVILLGTVFAALLLLTYASIISTIYTRPPIIPRKYRISNEINMHVLSWEEREELRQRLIQLSGANKYHSEICHLCRCLKPERACHKTIGNGNGQCIPRLDHYCAILGTCVHYTNQKQFVLIFFWSVVMSIFCLSVSIPYYHRAALELPIYKYWSPRFWIDCIYIVIDRYTRFRHSVIVKIIVVCVFPLWTLISFTGGLIAQIVAFSGRNLTFMDYLRAARAKKSYRCCKIGGGASECFNRGSVILNMRDYFGDVRFWLWPQHTNRGNPWSHDCACLEKNVLKQVAINME